MLRTCLCFSRSLISRVTPSMPAWLSRRLPQSIRRRTLLVVLLLLTFFSLLISIISFKDASHETEELFDARLAQQARILQALTLGIDAADLPEQKKQALQTSISHALIQNQEKAHKYENKVAYQVWRREELLFQSDSAPAGQLSTRQKGFDQREHLRYQWRTFTLSDYQSGIRVIVAEREDVRGELVDKIVAQTLAPDLISLPLMGILMWWAIGWGLSPLQHLAQLIRNRDPGNLEAIELRPLPDELAPVQYSLNSLLEQIRSMMAREQRLIADAAHELRTPLAVLKIHAQNAMQAETSDDRNQALEQMVNGVDRSARIVSQLLTLARLEHQQGDEAFISTQLIQESRQQLAQLMPLAWDKSVEVSLEADETLNWETYLEKGCLEIILQNLVSNSVKFSSEGSDIQVEWQQSDDGFSLIVRDKGPGVPDEVLNRMTERFFRSGHGAGAGLGLSIVQRIVERHGGSMRLSHASPGLRVCLVFPRTGLVDTGANSEFFS
ncbi:ATP-binding protein [Oceanospirillum sediminis]|uniref:histidine kinase n=1 Tax=Oceanospirillum sediminis TaxID=2760088 RepID=A0A839IMG2_9GAMM|nr:ATP-binding protein [Oceanospirillum sediminis]MBB1485699.1 sensor histidine kinase N-terminal domain-containing protein [Oceanospirillum sediminis]